MKIILAVVITTVAGFVPSLQHRPSVTMAAWNSKKPKTASQWASYRRQTVTLKKETNATSFTVEKSTEDLRMVRGKAFNVENNTDVRMDWEQKLQFDAMRQGNKARQHDILRSSLCI